MEQTTTNVWQDIDLNNISPQMEVLPAQEYTFQLLPGARYSDYDPARIELSAAITEGDFAGRRVFFSYPDPTKQDWSPRMLKRLVQALGGPDMEPGEDKVEYLNRVQGHRFAATIKHRKYTPEGGNEVTKAELNIFSTRPSA